MGTSPFAEKLCDGVANFWVPICHHNTHTKQPVCLIQTLSHTQFINLSCGPRLKVSVRCEVTEVTARPSPTVNSTHTNAALERESNNNITDNGNIKK